MLRENFNSNSLKSLQFDIPFMALTATATNLVREDIIKSLHMSTETETILTSFFRPNLRFSVKHSRTSSVSSYHKDFKELIRIYTVPRKTSIIEQKSILYDKDEDFDSHSSECGVSDGEETTSLSDSGDDENENFLKRFKVDLAKDYASPKKHKLTVEYLEDELDNPQIVDDLDVSCGEFPGISPPKNSKRFDKSNSFDTQGTSVEGPTIIYVPTRKETLKIAEYLCRSGVKAAAYHAKLTKSHLRHVHDGFHQGSVQVVVATIAFGMGIDKPNVRRIIHYGWPQSLEAYYQEAGRAGRDGKLADCTLYANLSRIPTLLPSQRSDEQTKQAYKMLSDCFRYAMDTITCRAKTLVGYFGEEFSCDGCHLCDICVAGPPKIQNMKAEVDVFLGMLKAEHGYASNTYIDDTGSKSRTRRRNFKMVVSQIREQFQNFTTSEQLWWRGLARILDNLGYIKEGDDSVHVSIRFPELTELGLRYLQSETENEFFAYPEADMLLSTEVQKPYSSFSEWGRGWADPEIRRQRLKGKRPRKRKRIRNSRKDNGNSSTVRGRLAAKLSKKTSH
ncbi:ATP-dependent DNA helicase Q-like SIM [Canna indica]|uniref:DNA 3'-5' helicase n=1 Tax=Canna indica TaxID=4628 RepID=A0AAQ3K8Q0_9LILI|nr:ATP-dependent DNA helicase Q-like SIM [Canna indica]